MSLFEIIESPAKKDDYSNTIEIHDALPKYIWDQKREHEDLSNAVVTRQCTIRGQHFTVKVKPAIIEKDDGRTVLIYAGQREEILEDALRKLAVNGKGHIIEGKAGVMFTLYELQKELSKMGHGYNLNEIKEAIQFVVAQHSNVSVMTAKPSSAPASSRWWDLPPEVSFARKAGTPCAMCSSTRW